MKNNKAARVIAFYLPQFHTIKENDQWWGPGFTEWHSVSKARPLFRRHDQPKIPADLGFYDLRVAETREAQAKLAEFAGIEGFCYWHYWFGGNKRLLERPFQEVLKNGSPNIPFCLGWANHNWYQKLWDPSGRGDKLLIEQEYLGVHDYDKHFIDVLLPAFKDERYIRVDNKPIFVIYSLDRKKEISEVISCWSELAVENGLNGIYFVAVQRTETNEEILNMGFSAMYRLQNYLKSYERQSVFMKVLLFIRLKLFNIPRLIPYDNLKIDLYSEDELKEEVIPIIIPNYDHTPRSGGRGFVLTGSTPFKFASQVRKALTFLKSKSQDKKLLFLVSWNEWGEGNYMEPDQKFGHQYLEALRSEIVTHDQRN